MVKGAISFLGLTHLGLVTSICFASLKFSVIAVDDNSTAIKQLNDDEVPISEPGLQNLLKKSKKYFNPTSDFSQIKKTNIIFIVKDTPLFSTSTKDLDNLIAKALPHIKDNSTIILMSQVPVGYTKSLYKKIKASRPTLKFRLYYWLNTLIIGQSIDRFLKPERIVLGLSDSAAKTDLKLQSLLKMFDCPVLTMSYTSAEMTKSAVNLYLASAITTANALADYCEFLGADLNEVASAMRLDKRIGQNAYLKPTIRIAGGHLERELIKLSELGEKYNLGPNIVKYLIKLNEKRYLWALNQLHKHISKRSKSKIAIWGLAYKKDTESVENAASIKIIKALAKEKHISIYAYDPKAQMPKNLTTYTRQNDKYQILENADTLLILTEWDEFRNLNIKKVTRLMKSKTVIDCVGILYEQKQGLQSNNFTYISMGVSPGINSTST